MFCEVSICVCCLPIDQYLCSACYLKTIYARKTFRQLMPQDRILCEVGLVQRCSSTLHLYNSFSTPPISLLEMILISIGDVRAYGVLGCQTSFLAEAVIRFLLASTSLHNIMACW